MLASQYFEQTCAKTDSEKFWEDGQKKRGQQIDGWMASRQWAFKPGSWWWTRRPVQSSYKMTSELNWIPAVIIISGLKEKRHMTGDGGRGKYCRPSLDFSPLGTNSQLQNWLYVIDIYTATWSTALPSLPAAPLYGREDQQIRDFADLCLWLQFTILGQGCRWTDDLWSGTLLPWALTVSAINTNFELTGSATTFVTRLSICLCQFVEFQHKSIHQNACSGNSIILIISRQHLSRSLVSVPHRLFEYMRTPRQV